VLVFNIFWLFSLSFVLGEAAARTLTSQPADRARIGNKRTQLFR